MQNARANEGSAVAISSVVGGLVLSVLLVGVAAAQNVQPGQPREKLTIQDLMGSKVQVGSIEATDLLTAPSTVTVIDSATIREFNIQSVSEAVNLVAGFMVLRTYIKRDVPTARGVLQDQYANKVLVLINNVPTWMAVTGEGALARIDIHDVDRIEVLKGPASVLYGTNAYAGAINIVLKSANEYRSEAQIGLADRFGFTSGANVLLASRTGEMLLSANATDAPVERAVFTDEAGVTGRVSQFMTNRSFTFNAHEGPHAVLVNAYSASESFLGTSPTFALGVGRDHQLSGTLLNYSFTSVLGRGAGLFLSATYDWNQRDFSRTADDLERAKVQGYRALGSAKTTFELMPALNLQAGLEWERRTSQKYENYNPRTEVVLADNNMKDRSVDEKSAFLQLAYSRARLHLLAGARYTHNELFGSNVSSRATAVYSLGESSSLKLMAGQSYRVPSLFELFFRTPTNTVYGNTALKPEANDTVELAYTGSRGNLYFEGLVYHARYDSKIYRERRYPLFVSNPKDTSLMYVNGKPFTANGVEVEARYRWPHKVNAFLNYAYVDGDHGDEIPGTNNYNFKYVPKHTLAAGLSKYLGNAWGAGVASYESSMGAPLTTIDSQVTFDLTVGYGQRVGPLVLRHLLSAKNLTDKDVEYPEYVRRNINSVPSSYSRRISYTLQVGF
jgi:outer membrane receptor protein involved in Fe transport